MNCPPKVGHTDQRLEVRFYGKRTFHKRIQNDGCSICAGRTYPQRNIRKVDSEFRLKVLQYRQEHNLSCKQPAMHFCLDVVTVCRRDKIFREKGMQGLMMNQKTATPAKKQKAQEQAELKRENRQLEEENLRLRMENDY